MNRPTRSVNRTTNGHWFPTDLVVVGAFVAATYATLSLQAGAFLRVVAGFAMVCFLPGYVTTAVLFPWRYHESPSRRINGHVRISLRERGVLSVGLSIAVVPALVLVGARFANELSTEIVFGLVSGYVVLGGFVAAFRRLHLPASERLVVPFGAWLSELRNAVTAGSGSNRVLTAALIASVVLAGGTFAFAVATPVDGQTYTDFHLLTHDGDEYVTAEYPENLVEGEPTELTWGIESHEATETDYTVVVTLERVTETDDELVRTEVAELDRTSTTVEPGERERHDHEIAPPFAGEDLRIGYYLYRGDAAESPSEADAYRHLHIWVDVEPGT